VIVKSALTQLSRIRGLSLIQVDYDFKGHDTFFEVVELLESPAPLLETFVVHLKARRADANGLPENLFSGHSPQLTHLHITNCALNWGASLFTNLKSLKVYDNVIQTVRPPADQFISALSKMPRLETLEFHSEFAWTSGGVISHTRIANLPHLVHLGLRYHVSDCGFLLDHITYPGTTSVHILCDKYRFHEERTSRVAFEGLVESLANRIQNLIRSMAFRDISLQFWTSTVTSPSNTSVAPQLDFQIAQGLAIEVFSTICERLPLIHLGSLMVHLVHPTEAMWLDSFGDLKHLENIHVVFDSTAFLRVLSMSTTLKRSDPTVGFKFRALRDLTVSGWTFDEDLGVPKKTCIGALKYSLKARQKKGMALSKLVVKGCYHVQEDDVADLQKIVKQVEWDGDRGYSTEESDEEDYNIDDDEESEAEETEAGESDSSG